MRSQSEVLALLYTIADSASFSAAMIEDCDEEGFGDEGQSVAEYNAMIDDIVCVANYIPLLINESREGYILVPDEFQKWLDREDSWFDEYFDTI